MAKQSCSSTRSTSSGPTPAFAYACLAALRVKVLTSGNVRSRSVHGSEVRTDASTLTFAPSWRAFSGDTTTTAADPSPVGQHM